MAKKKTKSKKRIHKNQTQESRAECPFERQSENEQIAIERSDDSACHIGNPVQTSETVSPSFLKRAENVVRKINKIALAQGTNLFIVSALVLLALLLIQSSNSLFSTAAVIFMIPAIGGLLAALICALSFVLHIFFLYCDLQRISENKNTGFSRFLIKGFLWSLRKPKTWAVIGAIIASTVFSSQFGIDSIYQLTKQYNTFAFASFALAQTLLLSYLIYISYGMIYQIILAPFDDLIIKKLGLSLSPHVPLKKIMGMLIGGSTLYIILMLAACLIDPQILTLSDTLTAQVVETQKTWIVNQQLK